MVVHEPVWVARHAIVYFKQVLDVAMQCVFVIRWPPVVIGTAQVAQDVEQLPGLLDIGRRWLHSRNPVGVVVDHGPQLVHEHRPHCANPGELAQAKQNLSPTNAMDSMVYVFTRCTW